MWMIKLTVEMLCVTMICSICFCGIFTPRNDFEKPAESGPKIGDLFSFSLLLAGTDYTFTRLDGYELFHEELSYTNVRSFDPFSQEELINHLGQQHDIYPTVGVSWVHNQNNISPKEIDNIELIELNNVTYTVTIGLDSIISRGTSNFEIIREDQKFWRILKWTDIPETDNSFFSPRQ